MTKHNYSLSDIDMMIPFELQLYIDLLKSEAEKVQQGEQLA